VGTAKQHDEVFWNAFHKETENVEVCKAVFDYIATYKLDGFNPRSKETRFSNKALAEQKLRNLESTHKFLVEAVDTIFGRGFLGLVKKYPKADDPYLNISKTDLYKSYKTFSRSEKQRAVDCDSFVLQLAEIKITTTRKNLGRGKIPVFKLSPKGIKEKIREAYKIPDEVKGPTIEWTV